MYYFSHAVLSLLPVKAVSTMEIGVASRPSTRDLTWESRLVGALPTCTHELNYAVSEHSIKYYLGIMLRDEFWIHTSNFSYLWECPDEVSKILLHKLNQHFMRSSQYHHRGIWCGIDRLFTIMNLLFPQSVKVILNYAYKTLLIMCLPKLGLKGGMTRHRLFKHSPVPRNSPHPPPSSNIRFSVNSAIICQLSLSSSKDPTDFYPAILPYGIFLNFDSGSARPPRGNCHHYH